MDNNELEEELLQSAGWGGDFRRVRELVEIEGVDVNCVDEECGMTPLMWAAWKGHFRIVHFLLGNGANVHAVCDHKRQTALSRAVDNGNVAIARLLLESGAKINKQFLDFGARLLPLGLAIFNRNVEMVAFLLRFGANTQETSLFRDKTYTALHLACWRSSVEIVQLLLDHEGGANVVNAFVPRDLEGDYRGDPAAKSPLCKACEGDNLEMVQLLIQRGARVIYNGVYPESPCPLVHAVFYGSVELVRFLLDQTNLQREVVGDNNHPLSPALDIAVRCNKLEAAQLLVDRGANVNDRAFLWHCANYKPNRWSPREDERIGVARRLLRAGADVNLAEPERGETPLWAAAKNGHVETVKEFLKARADVSIRDNGGETPLGVAYRQGQKGIVFLLLRTSPHVWPHLAGALFGSSVTDEMQQPAPKKQKTS